MQQLADTDLFEFPHTSLWSFRHLQHSSSCSCDQEMLELPFLGL